MRAEQGLCLLLVATIASTCPSSPCGCHPSPPCGCHPLPPHGSPPTPKSIPPLPPCDKGHLPPHSPLPCTSPFVIPDYIPKGLKIKPLNNEHVRTYTLIYNI